MTITWLHNPNFKNECMLESVGIGTKTFHDNENEEKMNSNVSTCEGSKKVSNLSISCPTSSVPRVWDTIFGVCRLSRTQSRIRSGCSDA